MTPGTAEVQNDQGGWDVIPPTPPPSAPVVTPDEPDTPVKAETPAPVADPEKPAKPRNDPQARIDQAIARQRDAERRAEQAEQRARDLEARTKPVEAPKPVTEDPEPDPANLQTYPEGQYDRKFIKDQARWEARQEFKAARAAQEQQDAAARHEDAFKAKVQVFGTRLAEAAKADTDLMTRIDQRLLGARPLSLLNAADKQALKSIPDPTERDQWAFRCFLADQWIDSDHAIAILEHLSDPQTFQRFATLPPNQVIRELAKLEARASAAPVPDSAPAPVQKSKAPPPVDPVGSSPHSGTAEEPGDDASDDEWYRWKQARAKRGRR